MTITRKTWTRMVLLLLLLVLAGWGMWACFTRPVRLRLVATMPVGKVWLYAESPVMALQPGCLFLRAEPLPTGQTRLTLIGWDAQPHWSVTTTLRAEVVDHLVRPSYTEKATTAALSPDGRTFALGEVTGATLRITSWRDGQPLGTVRLPWTPVPTGQYATGFQALWATDSGRVWVFDNIATRHSGPYRFWAIAGTRVAIGCYTASFPGGFGCLAPSGTHFLAQGVTAMDYVTLSVQGRQVRATRIYSQPIRNEFLSWLDESRLRGSHGQAGGRPSGDTLLGPRGVLERGRVEDLRYSDYTASNYSEVPLKLRLYDLARNRSWPLRTVRVLSHAFGRTPDHGTLLVEEQGMDPHQYPLLAALLNRFLPPRLAVYTAPGRLRAVLPDRGLAAMVGDPGLSPDGHHAAYLAQVGEGQYVMRVYAWGK